MATRSPLARMPAFLPRVRPAVPAEAFGHPRLHAAVEAVYDAQGAAARSPRDPNLARALQRAYTTLTIEWQQFSARRQDGAGPGTTFGQSFQPPHGAQPMPDSLLEILNGVALQYDPSTQQLFAVPAGLPGSPEAAAAAAPDYSSILDAVYNSSLIEGGVKALAAVLSPLATASNVAKNTPRKLYQNLTTMTQVVYVRADSPNSQVSALFLAGQASQAAIGLAPLATFSAPMELVALMPRNATLYGAVNISGSDSASIVVTGVALQGAASLGLGGSF